MTRTLYIPGGRGLFASIIQAIAFINDFINDEIIIIMGEDQDYYDEKITRTDNVWEYYFCPANVDTQGEGHVYFNYFGGLMKINRAIILYEREDRFINIAHKIFEDRIKIRKEILKIVGDFYEEHMRGKKVLSLHKRNKSHYTVKTGHFLDKGGKLTIEYYLECADNKMKDYDKIFLLTDEEEAYDAFKKKYKDDLIHYDAIMSKAGTYILESNSGYKLGEDVIVEALLASKTDCLVGGRSNVSTGIRIFNNKIIFDQIDKSAKFVGGGKRKLKNSD